MALEDRDLVALVEACLDDKMSYREMSSHIRIEAKGVDLYTTVLYTNRGLQLAKERGRQDAIPLLEFGRTLFRRR